MKEFVVPIKSNRAWEGLPLPSKTLYEERYFVEGESYETWLDRITRPVTDDREHRGRMKEYIRNYWVHPSTPISLNCGLPERGNTVACFVQEVADSKEGISNAWTEGISLGSLGGGIGQYWGAVRGVGAKVGKHGTSSGIVPFLKVGEDLTQAISQGVARRAQEAVYIPISHPEIEEFIMLRDPSGDINRRTPSLFNGVSIPDAFMEAVLQDAEWDLICPKTKTVVKSVRAVDLWVKLLKARKFRGTPFILFIDTIHRNVPIEYTKEGFHVVTSNLCTEITLATSPEYTAVCVLLSLNLEYWDEWGTDDTIRKQFLQDVHRYLDNIVSNFIDTSLNPEYRSNFDIEGLTNATRSAMYERSIGIGTMGYHYMLQKQGVPLTAVSAAGITKKVYSTIRKDLDESNRLLAEEKGACPLAEKHGLMKRNTHLMAIAPTASISTLCGLTSQGVDPLINNCYVHKTNKGSFTVRNRYLEKELEKLGMNTEEVWRSILDHRGSVQHLDIPETLKECYKTAYELPQEVLIELASIRQESIDQAQSVNLFFPTPTNPQVYHDVHLLAWKKGLKSLYYVRSEGTKKVGVLKQGQSAKQMMNTEDTTSEYNEVSECFWCG